MRETPVTVVGTLVSDVRARRVGPEERLVLSFRVASNERRFDKASESWVDGESLYLSVNCWRRLAENAALLVKGDPVIVSGRLRTREWTTEQGERRSVVEMEAIALGPDLARCTATVRRRRKEEEPASAGDGLPAPDEHAPAAGPALSEHVDRPDQVGLPGQVGLPDQVGLSELAQAARPLVPEPV